MSAANHLKLLIKIILLLFFLSTFYNIYASSNGFQVQRADPNSIGCDCHGEATDKTLVTARIPGGPIFKAGQKKRITISVDNPDKKGAGINVAMMSFYKKPKHEGELIPGDGTKIRKKELTHSKTMIYNDGCADFSFEWLAPKKKGIYYLLVAATAVDMDRSSRGDDFNWMEPLEIEVK